jgi:hypothetical protein
MTQLGNSRYDAVPNRSRDAVSETVQHRSAAAAAGAAKPTVNRITAQASEHVAKFMTGRAFVRLAFFYSVTASWGRVTLNAVGQPNSLRRVTAFDLPVRVNDARKSMDDECSSKCHATALQNTQRLALDSFQ